MIGRFVPVRFITFSLVGVIGIVVHLLIDLGFAFQGPSGGIRLKPVYIVMTFNFALNNALTYRDVRLRGWGWIRGWVSFSLGCSVGALANVDIVSHIYSMDTFWVFSFLVGILIGVVRNYEVTEKFTWRKPRV